MARDFVRTAKDPMQTTALLIEWAGRTAPRKALAGLVELDSQFAPVALGQDHRLYRAFPLTAGAEARLGDCEQVRGVWTDGLLPDVADDQGAADDGWAMPLFGSLGRSLQGRGQVVSLVGASDRMRQVVQAQAPQAALHQFGALGGDGDPGRLTTGDVLQALALAIHGYANNGMPQVLLLGCDLSQSPDFLPGVRHPLTRLLDQAVALGMAVVFAADGESAALALGGKGPQAMPLWLARTAGARAWADVLHVPGAGNAAVAAATLAGLCAILSGAMAQSGASLLPGQLRSALIETALDGEIRPRAALHWLTQQDEAMDRWDRDDAKPYPLHARQPLLCLGEGEAMGRSFEDFVGGQTPATNPETDLLSRIAAAQAVLDHLVAQYRDPKGRVPALMDRL